jgi:PAS domain S-box-containing protein
VLYQHGGRLSFNNHAERLLGMSLSGGAAAVQYASRIFYPDGRPVPLEEFPSTVALAGREKTATELVIRRDDGSEVPILGSAAPLFDEGGRILGAVAVFQDISESVRLQRAARDNERVLQAVFDLMPTGVRIADGQGKVIRTNRSARELWRGKPDGPAQGEMKAWWVGSGEPLAHQDWPARRAVRGISTVNELVRMQCFDGSFRTVMKYAAPLRDEQGRVTGAVVVDEDVTMLYEVQQRLQESERLFRTVIELLPVGVEIADSQGEVLVRNPAAERIWQGLRHVEPGHQGERKGWWIDNGQPVADDEWGITRAVRRGQTSRSELIRIQCHDGSNKTVINWAAPIRSETGEITGAVALNEDVTTLYQTQEQLRAAVRDREHILAVVAHDLRNPLSALILRAAALEQRGKALPGGEAVVATASAIREVARGMSGLVDDLLAISVARSGQSMLKFEPVPAQAVVEKAADGALPLFLQAGLQIVVEAEGELPAVHVDPLRIQRVFANLLDNARKFTEPGGMVVVRAEPAPGGVLFSVANTGPSLQAHEMERMFQPFWQAGSEDRRGAGLGLSICRSIIEAHGGSVWTEAAHGMRVKIQFLLPSVIPLAGVFPRVQVRGQAEPPWPDGLESLRWTPARLQ